MGENHVGLDKANSKTQGKRGAARITKRMRSVFAAKTMKWKSQKTSESAMDFLADDLSEAMDAGYFS